MEGSGFNIVSFVPFILIFVLMYFLIIRPQNKKAKEHQSMVQSLEKGDKVIMNGGLIGTITKLLGDTELEIALEEGAKARVVRSMVASIIKGTGALQAKTHQAKASAEKTSPTKSPVKKAVAAAKKSTRGKPSKK
jgi:preprotein translocase subunit YajC